MRDIKSGDSKAPLQLDDLGSHFHPQLGVDIGERLLPQKNNLGYSKPAAPPRPHAPPRASLLVVLQANVRCPEFSQPIEPSLQLALSETSAAADQKTCCRTRSC